MYVKKFEGESLTETLNMVKKELGPDAIILKTITNKGLKGAFKKSRVEITAAISEQSYINKSKVDKAMDDDSRERFYNNPAGEISKQINSYNNKPTNAGGGYGNMGLNKVVNSVSKASSKLKESLDDFLGSQETEAPEHDFDTEELEQFDDSALRYSEEVRPHSQVEDIELLNEVQSQKNKITSLERQIEDLKQRLEGQTVQRDDQFQGLEDLKMTLRTLDLNEKSIQDIAKKANFELAPEELQNTDTVFEFALRELNESIHTEMPLFSDVKVEGKPVVTAIVSESALGQSSLAMKLAVLNDKAKIIKFRFVESEATSNFAASVFDLNIVSSSSIPHMLGEIRKSIAANESVILDIKMQNQKEDESKKVLETLRRSFEFIEVLITTSAINSEIYNRKILSKYQDLADGVIISYMDQCMNFGSLLNTHYAYRELPLKFFGTGPTIPDDIEAATAERLLTSMFKL